MMGEFEQKEANHSEIEYPGYIKLIRDLLEPYAFDYQLTSGTKPATYARLEHIIKSHDRAEIVGLVKDVDAALEKLPPRKREALRIYYGLDASEPQAHMTHKEIGMVMGVGRQRAGQLIRGAQFLIRVIHGRRKFNNWI